MELKVLITKNINFYSQPEISYLELFAKWKVSILLDKYSSDLQSLTSDT